MTLVNCKTPREATILECPGTIDAAFLSQALEGLRRDAPWHVPVFQALLASEINLIIPLSGQLLPMARLASIEKPSIVLICDDGPISVGPDGWTCASSAFTWAAAAIINGTSGKAAMYESAVQAAREIKRLTIADTSSAYFAAWRACAIAAGDKPIVGYRPPLGLHHPREVTH